MCKCTPAIRTPYCGKGECVWPGSKPEGARSSVPQDVEEFIQRQEDLYGYIPYEDLRTWMAGHVRVPVEPTEEMIDAGYRMDCIGVDKLRRAYKAMLNASKGGSA